MPCLQKLGLMLHNQLLDSTQFHRLEAKIPTEADRFQPELGGKALAINVYMRWLAAVVTIEVEPVWT
jgi:hypothetical protein